MRSAGISINGMAAAAAALLLISGGSARAQNLRALFQRVSPTVAVISTEERDPAAAEGEAVTAEPFTGSGFLISPDGKMITAAHVVQLAEKITVRFPGGQPVKARVIASDPAADVALLQLERVPPEAAVAKLGDAEQMQVGDEIIVVGAPLGVSQTLTYGHISGRRKPHRVLGSLDTGEQELLQTDAAVSPGNSGGPMFNMAGEVVGVVSFALTEAGGASGLNFMVTSNMVRHLLLEQQSPWSGMKGYHLTGVLAQFLNLPQPEGILVERVVAGSPAQRLGLRAGVLKVKIEDEDLVLGGDVILSIQGVRIGDGDWQTKIRAAAAQPAPGGVLRAAVLRSGRQLELRSAGRGDAETIRGKTK